jgi:hypothetical protein
MKQNEKFRQTIQREQEKGAFLEAERAAKRLKRKVNEIGNLWLSSAVI